MHWYFPCFQPPKACKPLVLALLLNACATAESGRHARIASSREAPSGSRPVRVHNLISEAELAALPMMREVTAYDAITQLRPEFLRAKPVKPGVLPPPPVVVFVDGVRQGGPDVLRTINASWVSEIRYYGATEAYHTLGAVAPTEAIHVTLAKR